MERQDRETERQRDRTDGEAGQTGRTDVLHLIATQIQQRDRETQKEAGEREIFELLFSVPFWRFFGGLEEFQQLHEKYEISSFAVWKKSSNSGEFDSRSSQKWNWEQRNLLVCDHGCDRGAAASAAAATGIFNVF